MSGLPVPPCARRYTTRVRPGGGVVTQRIANPCTPVRFRSRPPILPPLSPPFTRPLCQASACARKAAHNTAARSQNRPLARLMGREPVRRHSVTPMEMSMSLLSALLLPALVFFHIGRKGRGIVALVLQLTLIGWPIAALWAIFMLYWPRRAAPAGAPSAAAPNSAKPPARKPPAAAPKQIG